MNFENYVLGTLSQDAFVMVNKKLAKKIGFVEAGLLAELIFTHKYAKQENGFFEEGEHGPWFYLTQAKVEKNLGIKRREHENAIKNLVKNFVIEKKRLGLPAKNYFQIKWENIVEILEEDDHKPAPSLDCTKRTNKDGRNVQTGLDETYKQDWTKEPFIHINKKELKKEYIKKTDDDEKHNKINFDKFKNSMIVDFEAFKEFVNEFEENHPTYFDEKMYYRIYKRMEKEGLSFITYHEAIHVIKAMQARSGRFGFSDFSAYLIGGITRRRTSEAQALIQKEIEQAKKQAEKNAPTQNIVAPSFDWIDRE